jgi:Fe-S cluster biogenesis protein NfuA
MDLHNRIERALEEIRPFLRADGGDLRLVEVTSDFTVKVELLGTCEHCHISPMTMKAGVEQTIRTQVPEVQKVIAINGVESKATS